MVYPCIESTISLPFRGKLIRLWMNQETVEDDYLNDNILMEELLGFLKKKPRANEEIVEYLKGYGGINAVHIVNTMQRGPEFGAMVYFVEF